MAVKIKLKRLGRTRVPTYRIVVADARTKRDGRAIEEIGKYHPKEEPSFIEVNSERAQHWLSVGAQPTEPVLNILKITGDWQKFKGEPGAEGTLRTREVAPAKAEVFAEALKTAAKDTGTPVRPRPRAAAGAGSPTARPRPTLTPRTPRPSPTTKAETKARPRRTPRLTPRRDQGRREGGDQGRQARVGPVEVQGQRREAGGWFR